MPLYEYICPKCKTEKEEIQPFNALAIKCPKCKTIVMKRKVSKTSFSLKGTGWYKDHYGLKEK